MMTCYVLISATSDARAQQVSIVEQLADKSFIVEIDGAKYRALSAAQLREVETRTAQRKIDLETCQQKVSVFQDTMASLSDAVRIVRDVATKPDPEVVAQTARAERYKFLFESEHDLRIEAQGLMKRGRIGNFFENPWVKVGEKAVDFGLKVFLASRKR